MNIFNCPKKRRVSMKNLMNRVLVVLAISAVFAGNIAAAPKKAMQAADNTTASAKMALDRLMVKGSKGFAAYSEMHRKRDAATLREQIPGAKSDIAVLEAAVLTKDASKRADAFAPKGKATHAIAAIQLALLNDDLKDANAQLKASPSEANAAMVADKQAAATAAVAQLDEVATGWKSYMTQRNIIMGTIGIAAVGVAAYVGVYGVPASLQPYVSQATAKISEAYDYAKSTRVGQVIGSGLSTAREYGASAVSTLKQYPGMAVGAASTAFQAAKAKLGYGAPVVVTPVTQEIDVEANMPAYR
jgi:hypothetical protein